MSGSCLNPCTFWDENRVQDYLEHEGNPNAYVPLCWQFHHGVYQMLTTCPPLGLIGVALSPVVLISPCCYSEEMHLLIAGPISESDFANGNPCCISKQRAHSTLVGAKLLVEHGADVNLPATRGCCCAKDSRTLISAYKQVKLLDGLESLEKEVKKPKKKKSQAAENGATGAMSPETMMHRNPEAERWERRIKQYRSMNAMNGIIMPESVVAQMFSDFSFKEIYDKIANENKVILPASWKDDYANDRELGYIPEEVMLGFLAISDPAMAAEDRRPVEHQGAFETNQKKGSKHSNMKKSFARGVAEEAGRQAFREGLRTATGCHIM